MEIIEIGGEEKEFNPIENGKLVLLDGRRIELFPKAEKTDEKVSGAINLDTTGEYLTLKGVGSEIKYDPDKEAERQYNFNLFCENAWFFLEHAPDILSDSRLFLAPVKIQNGLAYTGTSGFRKPTLGIYLEWWLHENASTDGEGNLIYYISGSPLSGSNCCRSVTPEGECVDSKLRGFGPVWRSFMNINNRYNAVKVNYESYTLEEALIKLRGEDYKYRIQQLRYEARESILKLERNSLINKVKRLREKLINNVEKNKRLELKYNSEAIREFAEQYNEMSKAFNKVHGKYVQERTELKRQLHLGHIEGDYHAMLTEISKPMRDRKHQLSVFANEFMRETFGKNPNSINFQDVLKYAKQHLQ